VYQTETSGNQKIPVKETYFLEKRPMQKRHVVRKEICLHKKRLSYIKRDLHASKETCIHGRDKWKRDTFSREEAYLHKKRPTYIKRDQWT